MTEAVENELFPSITAINKENYVEHTSLSLYEGSKECNNGSDNQFSCSAVRNCM